MDKNGLKQLFDLQNWCEGLDFISLPHLPATCQSFSKITEKFTNATLDESKEPMVYLDMGLDIGTFKKRFLELLALSESNQVRAIGLIYRSHRENYQNYRLLWENRESKVLLQMSQIPRVTDSTSTMHLLQKMGIDLFSVEVRKPHFKGGGEPPLEATKRFDSGPLLFRRFKEWANHDQNLDCHCRICRDKSAGEFMEEYGNQPEDKGRTFRAANKLHECYCSLDEFALSAKYIRKGELRDYFKNKQGLKSADIRIPKTLFDFEKS